MEQMPTWTAQIGTDRSGVALATECAGGPRPIPRPEASRARRAVGTGPLKEKERGEACTPGRHAALLPCRQLEREPACTAVEHLCASQSRALPLEEGKAVAQRRIAPTGLVAPLPLATCRIVMRCSSRYCDMHHASMPVAAINITRGSNLWAQGCSVHQDGEAGRPGSRDATREYPRAVYSCGCGNANVRLWPCERVRAWPEGAYARREMVVVCIRTFSESDKCVFRRAVSPALVGRERDSAPGWLHSQAAQSTHSSQI
jgi:hypothetical protein